MNIFADSNIIQAVTPLQQPTDIYLGEYHYVSTLPYATSTDTNLLKNHNSNLQQLDKSMTPTSPNKNVKKNHNVYVREYRRKIIQTRKRAIIT